MKKIFEVTLNYKAYKNKSTKVYEFSFNDEILDLNSKSAYSDPLRLKSSVLRDVSHTIGLKCIRGYNVDTLKIYNVILTGS